ncbi:MAG: hypothetical protein PHC98_04990 [Syntrophotalea acetylenica]|nr:hypothetical protein [Syntrophotalea acetylenica]
MNKTGILPLFLLLRIILMQMSQKLATCGTATIASLLRSAQVRLIARQSRFLRLGFFAWPSDLGFFAKASFFDR